MDSLSDQMRRAQDIACGRLNPQVDTFFSAPSSDDAVLAATLLRRLEAAASGPAPPFVISCEEVHNPGAECRNVLAEIAKENISSVEVSSVPSDEDGSDFRIWTDNHLIDFRFQGVRAEHQIAKVTIGDTITTADERID